MNTRSFESFHQLLLSCGEPRTDKSDRSLHTTCHCIGQT